VVGLIIKIELCEAPRERKRCRTWRDYSHGDESQFSWERRDGRKVEEGNA
jgi:hypothetical protein